MTFQHLMLPRQLAINEKKMLKLSYEKVYFSFVIVVKICISNSFKSFEYWRYLCDTNLTRPLVSFNRDHWPDGGLSLARQHHLCGVRSFLIPIQLHFFQELFGTLQLTVWTLVLVIRRVILGSTGGCLSHGLRISLSSIKNVICIGQTT